MKRGQLKSTGGLRGYGLGRNNKPIKSIGRITQERIDRKKQWEIDHPPSTDTNGDLYYMCHICCYFGEDDHVAYVPFKKYVLEHIVPKGRLSLEESQADSNLGPSHIKCNLDKGSILLEDMECSPMTGRPNPNAQK